MTYARHPDCDRAPDSTGMHESCAVLNDPNTSGCWARNAATAQARAGPVVFAASDCESSVILVPSENFGAAQAAKPSGDGKVAQKSRCICLTSACVRQSCASGRENATVLPPASTEIRTVMTFSLRSIPL